MADYYGLAARQAWASALVTDAGTNPKLLIIKGGIRPIAGQPLPGSYQVVATLNVVGALGTATGGVVTGNTVVTQNNALHVTAALNPGVDSFVRVVKADGVTVVADLTGFTLPQVTTGADIPLTAWSLNPGGNV